MGAVLLVLLLVLAAPLGAQSRPLHLELQLTLSPERLTAHEGGGEYLASRVITGVLNTALATKHGKFSGDDQPEDDIYLLVAGRAPDGTPVATVLPRGALFRVYLNKEDADRDSASVSRHPIWAGTLADGEAVELTVAVLEYDGAGKGGPLSDEELEPDQLLARQAMVAAAGAALADATALADSVVGATLSVRAALATALGDSVDDLPGAFAVRLWNEGGVMRADWRASDDAEDRGDLRLSRANPLKARRIELRGDGSRYGARVKARVR